MNKSIVIILFVLVFSIFGCETQQLRDRLDKLRTARNQLTNKEVSDGLKEALLNGISIGSDLASKFDGYYKNPQIKIPFPDEIKKVEKTLRRFGLTNELDNFVESLNRGAEHAASKAKPIFANVIKSMTFQDAWEILKGDVDAATQYLRKTTAQQLKLEFKPTIHKSLQQVNATKFYSPIINAYNRIPGLTKVDPDIDDYVTEKAIDGLFTLVAAEEAKIRKDPLARTTELLKKVFALIDN